jgi:hypothetical protein
MILGMLARAIIVPSHKISRALDSSEYHSHTFGEFRKLTPVVLYEQMKRHLTVQEKS